MSRPARLIPLMALVLLGSASCEKVEQIMDERRPSTPYEAYLMGLHDAGLAGTALSRAWIEEGAAAVQSPLTVDLPFREEGFIAAEDPDAVGYRFHLERGQVLTVRLALRSEEPTRVFLDLFRLPENPSDPLRPVEADTLADGLRYEPYRGGDYVVRVQPELLRGGQYEILLTLDPSLAFPVADHGMRAIQSGWGAPREGGRRSHEGVDIFARRGTPVVASVAGRVSRVDTTRLGGKVVWLRDEARRRSVYYAHLDSQAVVRGQYVEVGDTVGFVGNTGNARTTPPHLHYGVYYRGEGAVDPAPFLRPPPGRLAEVEVDRDAFGSWQRVRAQGANLRSSPSLRAPVVAELTGTVPARILGGSADWYRVRLPDGTEGYLSDLVLEPVTPVESWVAEADLPVLASPRAGAPRASILAAGTAADVVGRFSGFLQVATASGATGWVPDPSPSGEDGTATAALVQAQAGGQQQDR